MFLWLADIPRFCFSHDDIRLVVPSPCDVNIGLLAHENYFDISPTKTIVKLKLFAPTERYRTGAPPCMGLSENRVPLNPRVLSSVSLLELNFGGPNSQTHRGFYRDTRGLIGGLNEYDTCVYIYIYTCVFIRQKMCV